MFGLKKKNAEQPKLVIRDGEGGILYEGPPEGLILEEEIMKALSLQYFGDPEPCEIHRSAVMSQVGGELRETLVPGVSADPGSLEDLRDYFAAYPGARSVTLTDGGNGGGR